LTFPKTEKPVLRKELGFGKPSCVALLCSLLQCGKILLSLATLLFADIEIDCSVLQNHYFYPSSILFDFVRKNLCMTNCDTFGDVNNNNNNDRLMAFDPGQPG